MKTLYRKTLLALGIATLTACGGGGGGGNTPDRNNSGANNQTMQLLQKGVYDMSFYRPSISQNGHHPLMLTRTHQWIDSAGIYQSDTEYLTTDGWRTQSQVDEKIFIGNPTFLTLSASGWQPLEDIPCSASPFQDGVAIRCAGLESLTKLDGSTPLVGDSLAETFADLAKKRLFSSGGDIAAVTAATSGLTNLLGEKSSKHRLIKTYLTDELVTRDCRPGEPDQPIADWSCWGPISATAWEELSLSDESFSVFHAVGTMASNHTVHLNGDLANATSGDIVVDEDSAGNLAPGTVIGTWEKRVLHGQTFIRLNRSQPSLEIYEALAIVNGKIVKASYTPANNPKPTGAYYSPEAAIALSDAAIGIFPIE